MHGSGDSCDEADEREINLAMNTLTTSDIDCCLSLVQFVAFYFTPFCVDDDVVHKNEQ
jgi:hypothetical protein